MKDIIILGVVLAIVVLAAVYVIRAKKKGTRCIGCPGNCQSCSSCQK